MATIVNKYLDEAGLTTFAQKFMDYIKDQLNKYKIPAEDRMTAAEVESAWDDVMND